MFEVFLIGEFKKLIREKKKKDILWANTAPGPGTQLLCPNLLTQQDTPRQGPARPSALGSSRGRIAKPFPQPCLLSRSSAAVRRSYCGQPRSSAAKRSSCGEESRSWHSVRWTSWSVSCTC